MPGPGFNGQRLRSLGIRSTLAAWSLFLLSLQPTSSGLSAPNVGQQSAPHPSTAEDEPQRMQANPIKVGIVKDEVDGCTLQLPADYKKQNDRNVFNSGNENSTDDCECAFMKLDDRLVKLKRIYSKWAPGGPDRVGKRGTQIYTARDTRVEVDWVVTHVCGPRDGEECEGIDFSATIKITRRGTSTTLQVRGGC